MPKGLPYNTATKKAKQDAFLEDFARHGIIAKACKTAGIERMTVYQWKEHSETFLLRFNQAFEDAKDNIRAEIYRRAHDGYEEDVLVGGKVHTIRKVSDTLLIFHAKMLMPEYRDKQQVELTGKDGTPLVIETQWGTSKVEPARTAGIAASSDSHEDD